MQEERDDLFVRRTVVEQAFLLFQLIAAIILGLLIPSFKQVWQIALAISLLSVLVIVLLLIKFRVESALDLDYKALKKKLAQEIENSDVAYMRAAILEKSVKAFSDLTREFISDLKKLNDTWEDLEDALPRKGTDITTPICEFTQKLSRRTLGKITSILGDPLYFRSNSRDVRATLFQFMNTTPGERLLIRYAYSYPQHLQPQTINFDERVEGDRLSAIFRCANSAQMYIVPDVEGVAHQTHEHGEPGWIDKRPGHSHEYGSMLCIPIISGYPSEPGKRFVGVVTLTCNEKYFFSDDPKASPFSKSFLSTILHPFIMLLGILDEIDRTGMFSQYVLDERRSK